MINKPNRKQKAMLHNVIRVNLEIWIQLAKRIQKRENKINMTSIFYTNALDVWWLVSIQSVAFSICGHFGLWPFRCFFWPFQFVSIPVCGRFSLWPFRSMPVSVNGRLNLWPFRFWPVRLVAVMTRNHSESAPKLSLTKVYLKWM